MNMDTRLKLDGMELHARNYAVTKAHEVTGEVVQMVLDRTHAELPQGIGVMEQAEAHVERRLAALLKNAIMEFAEMYTAELQRRTDAAVTCAEQALNTMAAPSLILKGPQ